MFDRNNRQWESKETTQKRCEAVAFKMAKGKPLDLEIEVNRLLSEGFTVNGDTFEYVIPGTSDKIFVQPMVKFEGSN